MNGSAGSWVLIIALQLDRQTPRNSTATGTTLVDPGAAYEKAGQDEDGKSGLQRLPTSATLVPGLRVQDEELGLLGTAAAPEQQAHAQPLGRLGKLRMYWRDYLVSFEAVDCLCRELTDELSSPGPDLSPHLHPGLDRRTRCK